MADAALERYARRFVWLELDYDKEANKPFFDHHDVGGFPLLYIFDPVDERIVATWPGGLALSELVKFLEAGEQALKSAPRGTAESALARGVSALGAGRMAAAATSLREALAAGGAAWPNRLHTLDLLTTALQGDGQTRACAETATQIAPTLEHDRTFVDIVLTGLVCANQGGAEAWATTGRQRLEPLAQAAMSSPRALRDDRFQLYEARMVAADQRHDGEGVKQLARQWLGEVEAITPRGEDERTALDVARVRAATRLGEPERVLPALQASERTMPSNYTASSRLASMALAAKHWDDAVAASQRGLLHASGAIGRTSLLVTEARALIAKGDPATARRVLEEALGSARGISHPQRDATIRQIQRLVESIAKPQESPVPVRQH